MSELQPFTPVELGDLERLLHAHRSAIETYTERGFQPPLTDTGIPLVNELEKHGGEHAVLLRLIAIAQRHALSDRQEAHVCEQLATQDNACTADPIFTVEQMVRDIGMDPDYSDLICWYNSESEREVLSGNKSDRRMFEALERGYEAGTVGDGWTRTGYRERWEFVQPFLTLEAAERFQKYMAHRLGETRIYVESGYRNHEWQWLRSLFTRVAP